MYAGVEFLSQALYLFEKKLLALHVINQSLQEWTQARRAVPIDNRHHARE